MRRHRKEVKLEDMADRYLPASRKEKTRILDELCDLYGYCRKYLIQVLNFNTGKQYIRKGRKRKYDPKVLLPPLTKIWLAGDQMCSKKLKVALPLWLPFYDNSCEPLSNAIKEQLLSLSPATIDRLLKPNKVKYKRHGMTGTRPGYLLKNQIPIKTDHWDVTQPGFLEADTVAHCGNSLAGNFVWSITLTDINSCWTENRATLGKGAEGVKEQIKNVEKTLPFVILGFDCDNGSEFLNWHLLRYFTERKNKVQFTRSRPYKKNDNAHVEQKNWTHVRQLFGYDRFENPILVDLMNDLYANEWNLYQNHFIPTLKLKSKIKVNSKYIRKYEKPKTPYQRLLDSEHITQNTKAQLKRVHKQLNPFELKLEIERKLKHIFKYVTVNNKPRTKI